MAFGFDGAAWSHDYGRDNKSPDGSPAADQPQEPGQSPGHPVTSAAVAAETRRRFWTSRWVSPFGTLSASVCLTLALWDRQPQARLVSWLVIIAVICAAIVASFTVSVFADRNAKSGLPRMTELGHAAVGIAYGALLWLPAATDDLVAMWTIVATMFAVSAGVGSGLSGLNRLSLRVIVPMWSLASIALLVNGQHLVGTGTGLFLAIVVSDQRRTGALFRELIALRFRETQQAEINAWRAMHDDLTGLLNRSGVTAMLENALPATTAMFIDLDHFKEVNDRFGHATGDIVLQQAASRLRASVRSADAIARIGGDEFFIVFQGQMTDEQTTSIGQSIIAALEEPFQPDADAEVWISASVGYTSLTPNESNPSRLMVEADHAMLHAKRSGRRQVAPFTTNLEQELQARSGLESAFRKAIRARAIGCAAQPVFDLATGTVEYVELLARWTLEGGSNVPPSIFIPLAEEVGLIDELSQLMLDTAGRCLAQWRDVPELRDSRISVNISPVQITKGKLLRTVAEAIERHNIEPGRLILELTESATLSEISSTVELFTQLRELGVVFAVDDFGTGYSSLGHLLSLPISGVKSTEV